MPPSAVLIGPANLTTVCAPISIELAQIKYDGNRPLTIISWELVNAGDFVAL